MSLINDYRAQEYPLDKLSLTRKINARSILPKIDYLAANCLALSPEVVCVTETWLNGNITNSELKLLGYTIVRLDRDRHGGGVMLFIKDNYIFDIITTDYSIA